MPDLNDKELAAALRHCPPTALEAARRFRRTRDAVHVPTILLGVLERYAGPEAAPVLRNAHDDLRLTEDLGVDSLSRLELALLLEEVLQISLPEEQLRAVRTLGDVRRLTEDATRQRAVA